MRKTRLLTLLVLLLMTAATGAWANWTGGTYTATKNESNGSITISDNAKLTINQGVTVYTGAITINEGKTLTILGPGELVVRGTNGGDGQNGGVAINGSGCIVVKGNANVTVYGGEGGNGDTGSTGGAAITCSLTTYSGTLTIIGGEGGRGNTSGNGGNAFDGSGTLTYYGGNLTVKGGPEGTPWDEDHGIYGNSGIAFANTYNVVFENQPTSLLNFYSNPITIDNIKNNFGVTIVGSGADPVPVYYAVKMKDATQAEAANWTIASGSKSVKGNVADGLTAVEEGDAVTLTYSGRLKVKGVKATSDAAPAAPAYNETKSINDGPVTVAAGEHWLITGTGTQTTNTMTIGAGATVTLDGVNISSGGYCIKCAGDATIILKDGSTNTLTGTGDEYPALSIGDANTTLTIQGNTGVLNVTSGDYCAGIGGGYSNTNSTCGNIRIEGGVITAQGGNYGAGIGSDSGEATCGDIIITGGTITANCGTHAAGIGSGSGESFKAVCGNITIANTVTKVTATAGSGAPNSIGKGYGDNASCGTITIGGTGYGNDGISTSPFTYPAAD